ncbi:MAG: hypothetical protein KA120_00325 [Candidatus Goldbacteria bacterium]|nr:hypothetical protein [Candidatus Goldiibacteriota bacterium]
MEDEIEKVNPINAGMEIKISGKNRIGYKKTVKGQKTKEFKEIFRQNVGGINEKEEKKSHAKYKNGRRIK